MSLLEDQLEWSGENVASRLVRVLLMLAERFGEPEGEGWTRLDLELKQEDLAALGGTTRVTVTQSLSELRDAGLVEGTRGHYRLRKDGLQLYLEQLQEAEEIE